mmetsp:Transcript_18176/g.55700  ORF Transcript_18176/g.55700 Transcript_18176/m.55700 type:complete len:254 (+) Transcript_18176:271-1032(+)
MWSNPTKQASKQASKKARRQTLAEHNQRRRGRQRKKERKEERNGREGRRDPCRFVQDSTEEQRTSLVAHVSFDGGGVDVAGGEVVTEGRGAGDGEEGGLAGGAFAGDLAVHGEGAPEAHFRDLAGLAEFQELDDALRREALVVVVVQLDHRRVRARAEALDFSQREHAVWSGRAFQDAEVLLDRLLDVFGTAHHARRRPAQLDEVLAHFLAIEHGVERGDFVDAHGGHVQQLRDAVHRRERQPAPVLSLGEVQ